jgi:hypothetical protein
LSDLLKHGIAIQQFAAISLLNATPDFSAELSEGGRSRLLAFFEQTETFAHHFARRGLIQAGGHAGLDELL